MRRYALRDDQWERMKGGATVATDLGMAGDGPIRLGAQVAGDAGAVWPRPAGGGAAARRRPRRPWTAAGWSWPASPRRVADQPGPQRGRTLSWRSRTWSERAGISSSFPRGVGRDGSNGGIPRLTHIPTWRASPLAPGLRLKPHRSPASPVCNYQYGVVHFLDDLYIARRASWTSSF